MTLEEQIQKLTEERDAARADRDLNIEEHAMKRARLEAERDALKDQREIAAKYEDRFFQAKALLEQVTAERDEEKAIVDRVWAALGISTYEQAKPLAIDEHVKRIIAERDAAQADLKAIGECVGGDPLAVRGLVESMDAVIKELDAALKACAEMRDFIKECEDDLPAGATRDVLSKDFGKGYHRDDEWKPVVEALKTVTSQVCSSDPWRQKVAAETTGLEALAHAEKLTSQ